MIIILSDYDESDFIKKIMLENVFHLVLFLCDHLRNSENVKRVFNKIILRKQM